MATTLGSILCGEAAWSRDYPTGVSIRFREDGTGDLQCKIEFWLFIATEFRWRDVSRLLSSPCTIAEFPSDPDAKSSATITAPAPAPIPPQLVGEVELELTLTTNLTRARQSQPPPTCKTNEDYLTDAAFQPRTHRIRIEQGSFPKLSGFSDGKSPFRLLFEPSPFPPEEAWKESARGPRANRLWERKEFVGMEFAKR